METSLVKFALLPLGMKEAVFDNTDIFRDH